MMFIIKTFLLRCLETIGVLITLHELYSIFIDPHQLGLCCKILVFLVIPIVTATIDILRKYQKTAYTITDTDTKISLSYGDILKKKGVVVIPVNQEFDVIVGNGIVSSRSLHGKFINRFFKNDVGNLENIINGQLTNVSYEDRPSKVKGNRKTYPLGTCVKIEQRNTVFVLAALTRFDNNCHSQPINVQIRNEFLSKVWAWIGENEEPSDVYMPLIGSGNSRMMGTSMEKYKAIVDSGMAAINQAKMFRSFNVVLQLNLDNILMQNEFDEYMRLKAFYKESASMNSANLGIGIS